ncbi:MAG: 6,7-dimethyl-8-ribityllumazine synthase [bacterium]
MVANSPILPVPTFDRPVKLLIVAAIYDRAAADVLIAAARKVHPDADLLEVPGALEVSAAIAMAERMAEFDGYIALGEVPAHGGMMVAEAWRSLSLLGLQGACIGNGIGTGTQDGAAAAQAALHLVAISRKWAAQTKGIGFRA